MVVLLVSLLLVWSTPVLAAMTFDGVDDRVDCNSPAALDTLARGPLSYSFWINYSSTGEVCLLCWDNNTTGWNHVNSCEGCVSGEAGLVIFFGKDASTDVLRSTDSDEHSVNVWNHFVVTWSGSVAGTNVKIYINGVESVYGFTQGSGTISQNDSHEFWMMHRQQGGRIAAGTLDEVYLYGDVLSALEARQLFSHVRGTGLQFDNLVAYWPMDEEATGTAADGETVSDFYDGDGTSEDCTAGDGANNTGMTWQAGEVLSYQP